MQMVGSRWYSGAVILFWIGSMSWLLATKIAPSSGWHRGGIQANPLVPSSHDEPEDVEWQIRWQGQRIGWAVYQLQPLPSGIQKAHSVVHFDDLPVGRIMGQLFGPVARWIGPSWTADQRMPVPMRVETHVTFDPLADSQHFVSTVNLGEIHDLITLSGMALDGTLHLVVTAADSVSGNGAEPDRLEIYRGQVDLPDGMSAAGTLSPLANLRDLGVGQCWRFQAYRPIPFGRPLRLAEASVEGESELDWEGRSHLVRHVILRYADDADPTAARQPFGELWVTRDGMVLKQRLLMGNLTIDFVRLLQLRHPLPNILEESEELR